MPIKHALQDLNVLEFGGYAAGPCIGKYLANFGAQVVHVESKDRPDGFRMQYPPYRDGKVGVNRSGCFAFFNDSKYGITLNLKRPEGLDLAYRLVDWADVVIENMRPGVLDKLGLGYETLRKRKSSLVMLSTNNLGQTGPYARHPGFGTQLSSLCGFTHFIGEADGPPQFIYGPYVDFIAVAFGGTAVLAAVDHQRRTKESVYFDLSQYEAGLQFLGGALLDYSANGANGVVEHRNGNHDPGAAPHGCYPCRNGSWCVISCWDDEEWSRFCRATGQTSWPSDERFHSFSQRKQNEALLNKLICGWTQDRDGHAVMALLQSSGVHAAAVNTMRDLFSDPQVAFRHLFQEMNHPEIGSHHYRMVAYQLAQTPGGIRSPAPCLGEHNSYVFQTLLGLPPEEYRRLEEQGIFS